ncbi:MAG: DUF3618 domain-containing protein [Actinomycetota bacterium]|nr:DUF3618 domain-containing protein [Actinomycetota bacterium]
MARDTDSIEREIERARDQLAGTLDELSTRANPKRLVAQAKETLRAKFDEPTVRYVVIGVGALAAAVLLRKLFR